MKYKMSLKNVFNTIWLFSIFWCDVITAQQTHTIAVIHKEAKVAKNVSQIVNIECPDRKLSIEINKAKRKVNISMDKESEHFFDEISKTDVGKILLEFKYVWNTPGVYKCGDHLVSAAILGVDTQKINKVQVFPVYLRFTIDEFGKIDNFSLGEDSADIFSSINSIHELSIR